MRKPVETTPPSVPEIGDAKDDEQVQEFRREVAKRVGAVVGRAQREKVVDQVVSLMVEHREEFQGPIAHPKHLREYEEICPGAADRVISMAEKQQDAQIAILTKAQHDDAADRKRGMDYGFASFVILAAGGVILGVCGQPILGGGFLTISALGVVHRFVNGRKKDP